jgi:hypothetical protein
MSSSSDTLALANLVVTLVIALCALYLSYAALNHTARPAIRVKMLSPGRLICREESLFVFEFSNAGHWYGRPTAIDVVVFSNFPPEFRLLELRYGSDQSYVDKDVRVGVGGLIYLKAKGLKLTHGEEGERIHVRAVAPEDAGECRIRISAFSENGVSLKREFRIQCLQKSDR